MENLFIRYYVIMFEEIQKWREKNMKNTSKILILLLIFSMILSLAACQKKRHLMMREKYKKK